MGGFLESLGGGGSPCPGFAGREIRPIVLQIFSVHGLASRDKGCAFA